MASLRVNPVPAIKKLEVASRNLVNTRMLGSYKSVFKGRGLEFESYRNYTELDDASLIDWKASIRGNDLLVKEFVEERNINVFFLIDCSSTMVFGSGSKLKNEYAAELASSLCYAVLQAGDSVGYALFSDKVIKKIPPARGPRQFFMLSKALVNSSNYGGGYDLGAALKFLMSYINQSSVVIIISDFIGLKGNWQKYIKMMANKYDMIGIMVRDVRDRILPDVASQIIMTDPYSNKQVLVRPSEVRDKFARYVKAQENAVQDVFVKSGLNFVSLSTDKPFVKPIMDLFMRRKRKFR